MSRRAYVSASLGVPVLLTPNLKDGEVVSLNTPDLEFGRPNGGLTILIGTYPRSELELARWHARWLVQQGLIDVLQWLGEKPIPKHPTTHKDILTRLRAHA